MLASKEEHFSVQVSPEKKRPDGVPVWDGVPSVCPLVSLVDMLPELLPIKTRKRSFQRQAPRPYRRAALRRPD